MINEAYNYDMLVELRATENKSTYVCLEKSCLTLHVELVFIKYVVFYSKEDAKDRCIIGTMIEYYMDITAHLFIAAICRNRCRTLGVKLVYKHLDSNKWVWEENNRNCRDLVASKVYDFSMPVDTDALSKEAEGFLSRVGLLYDAERAARAAHALALEARRDDIVFEGTKGISTKNRVSTRKKTPRTITNAVDPAPTPRMPKKQQRRPRSKSTQSNERTSSPPPFIRSPSVKRMDTKSTPPKTESEEFKIMKLEMEALRAELIRTKQQFEDKQNISNDKSITKIINNNTVSNAANNIKSIEKADDSRALEASVNNEVIKGAFPIGSVDITSINAGDRLTLHMMDSHHRESISRQQRQIELKRQTAIEEDLLREREGYLQLQMHIMRNYIDRR